MQILASGSIIPGFHAGLRRRGRGVLLLDFDGTLAPFQEDPADVAPYPGVLALLDDLALDGRTRVVVVTGRAIGQGLPQLAAIGPLEIWGSHGRERLGPDGCYQVLGIGPDALEALMVADAWAPDIEALDGRCERKPGSLAIHWRGLKPARTAAIHHLLAQRWREHRLARHLRWLDFDGGVELQALGHNKGDVVAAVLGEEEPTVPAAYLGDDHTDEDAFHRLRGRGLGILVRTEFRPTAAQCWLRPPAELLEFLAGWRRAVASTP